MKSVSDTFAQSWSNMDADYHHMTSLNSANDIGRPRNQ